MKLIPWMGVIGSLSLCTVAFAAQPSFDFSQPPSYGERAQGDAAPILEIPGRLLPEPSVSLTLPSPFVGCWEGTVDSYDSVVPSSAAMGSASVTYTFCYEPNPDGRTYELRLRKVVVAGKKLKVTDFENQVVQVDDGHRTAYLRNHTTAVDSEWLLFLIPVHITEDVYAEQWVRLDNAGNAIQLVGSELIKANGKDYATVKYHSEFFRVSELPTEQ